MGQREREEERNRRKKSLHMTRFTQNLEVFVEQGQEGCAWNGDETCAARRNPVGKEDSERISVQFRKVSISRSRSVYFLVSTTASDRIGDCRKSRL